MITRRPAQSSVPAVKDHGALWSDRKAPPILVFGADLPHLGSAGGVILHRLFEQWPLQALCAVGPAIPANVERSPCRFVSYEPPLWRLETTRAFKLMRLLRGVGMFPTGRFTLPEFHPAVIVTVLSSLPLAEAAYEYSLRSGVPLVLIVHDDPEEFNLTYTWAGAVTHRKFRRIYRHAARRLCVSPEMENVLRERYGVAGDVMFPNRSERISPRPQEASLALRAPNQVTLGFAGSSSYGYGPRLLELAPLFRRAGAKVRIFGNNMPEAKGSDVLLCQGRLARPEDVWTRIKDECDAVLMPYCFPNHGHQSLFQTHFPSKLPEYLALGMPVIIAGPNHATGVKWGQRNPDSCVVITEKEGDEWINAIHLLRDDSALRLRLSQNAVAAGNRDFDPIEIRTFFQKLLCKVAGAVL